MILLDTHAVIWWQCEPSPLPRGPLERIESADRLVISAVTCWEVATLVARHRVALDRPFSEWLAALRADPRIHVQPLSPDAAILAAELDAAGFHSDPADRLLYASALTLDAPFMTRDQRMHEFAKAAPPRLLVDCVWGD